MTKPATAKKTATATKTATRVTTSTATNPATGAARGAVTASRAASSAGPRPRTAPPVGIRLIGRTVGSGLVTVGLARIGQELPHHPHRWSALQEWLTATPMDAVAVHGVWLVGVGLGAQLTVAHVLATGGWLAGSTRTLRFAEWLSAGVVSRAWAGLVVGATATMVPAGMAAAQDPVAVAADADPAAVDTAVEAPPQLRVFVDTTADTPTTDTPTAGTATAVPAVLSEVAPSMRLLEAAPGPTPAPIPASDRTDSVAPGLGVWLVRPGDSLWDIAEAVLQREPGTRAEIDVVHDYWQRLIELNRHNLADPDNPDLLFSGQQLRLPPHG